MVAKTTSLNNLASVTVVGSAVFVVFAGFDEDNSSVVVSDTSSRGSVGMSLSRERHFMFFGVHFAFKTADKMGGEVLHGTLFFSVGYSVEPLMSASDSHHAVALAVSAFIGAVFEAG